MTLLPRFARRSFLVSLLSASATVAAAQQGTVSGTITSTTGQPIADATILVLGTSVSTTSGQDGKFILRRVPVGTAEMRAIRVGFQEVKRSVRVLDGQTATLDFQMSVAVVQMQPIVVTATGEQRRIEIGNSVANIQVADIVKEAPVRTIADVLNSRAAGVSVLQGTQTGTGQRIRIRGISSLSLSNEPIFIIDGIRLSANNGSTAFGNGGANFSRLGDLSPEDIENIEIVKGPSAATLYGTDAANGVVLITTKRGRTSSTRWNVYAESGILEDRNWYSDNYTLAGVSPTGAPLILSGQCTLVMVAAGTCRKTGGALGYDSLRVYTPIKDPSVTPLGQGNRNAFGVQVQGGSDAVRFFMSASRDDEVGVFKLDDYERDKANAAGIAIHPWQERPNSRLLNSFRTNLNATLNPALDVSASFSYSTNEGFVSNESNNTVGIGSQAFGGPGYRNNGLIAGLTDSLLGYRAGTPFAIWAEKLQQNTNRTIFATNMSWRPTSWLQTRANIGTDIAVRVDNRLHMNQEGWPLTSTYRDGEAFNARANITNLSGDLSATANYNPSKYEWMNLKTTIGTQYNNFRQDQNNAGGQTLPPGATTVSAVAVASVSDGYTLQKTLGVFIEEAVGLRDRLFLTGAIRSDQNSAFGTKFKRVFYPKASLSWVVSDEEFFPRKMGLEHLSELRLRVANGASGVQPGPNDALRTFSAGSASIKNSDLAIETFSAIGNDSLRPERSTEWETGFDSRWFGSRLQLDVTYYSRLTHDALIGAVIAPSLGSGSSSQRMNLGSVKNAGLEISTSGQIIDHEMFAFDFRVSSSMNANKVVSLGTTPPQIGVTNWIVAGYPINGIWARPILSWNDANGDGILTVPEVVIQSDTLYDESIDPLTGKPKHSIVGIGTFRGYAAPRYLTTFSPGVELFHRKLRVQSLFDWRGGNKYYNNSERIRCTRPNCNGMFNPNASFEEQAMVVASINAPEKTLDGYYQPGAFVKWRELTASYQLPNSLVRRTRARNASIVFSARNLKTWTNYRGSDPESDFTVTGGGDVPQEFQTFAAPTLFQFRLNFGW